MFSPLAVYAPDAVGRSTIAAAAVSQFYGWSKMTYFGPTASPPIDIVSENKRLSRLVRHERVTMSPCLDRVAL
jgi:hypothetical protein